MLKATNYVIFFILIYLFSTVAAVFKLFISWPFSFFFTFDKTLQKLH